MACQVYQCAVLPNQARKRVVSVEAWRTAWPVAVHVPASNSARDRAESAS